MATVRNKEILKKALAHLKLADLKLVNLNWSLTIALNNYE